MYYTQSYFIAFTSILSSPNSWWRRQGKFKDVDKQGLVAAASFPRDTTDMDTLSSQVTNPLYFEPGEVERVEPTISINLPEKD